MWIQNSLLMMIKRVWEQKPIIKAQLGTRNNSLFSLLCWNWKKKSYPQKKKVHTKNRCKDFFSNALFSSVSRMNVVLVLLIVHSPRKENCIFPLFFLRFSSFVFPRHFSHFFLLLEKSKNVGFFVELFYPFHMVNSLWAFVSCVFNRRWRCRTHFDSSILLNMQV